ncbi:hypothetical protein IV203_036935 [Nitzschia inconspicua]|uniref:Uncharacterized protein n=1 Tax=Nitzschia inconspicua TaxID=303405 RepID=A0A9K3LG77_9STRA|nr:hypothetical protein IV203_036935 [Nitzschia inconspicua]
MTANDLSTPPPVFPEPAPESLRVAVTINRSAPPDVSLASEQSPTTITKTLATITKHHPVMHHTLRPQTTSIASLKTYPTLKHPPHLSLHPLMRAPVSLGEGVLIPVRNPDITYRSTKVTIAPTGIQEFP